MDTRRPTDPEHSRQCHLLAYLKQDLEKWLTILASKLAGRVKRLSGRAREVLLSRSSHINIKKGECESFNKLEHFQQQLAGRNRELMTQLTGKENELEEIQTAVMNEARFQNTGKPIHELSDRQKRGKLSECKTYIQQALWFCESFGVKPECLEVSVNEEESLRMTLTSDPFVTSTSS